MSLRTDAWYAGDSRQSFIHRAWIRRELPADAFSGQPHIAVVDTASDLAPCNRHLTRLSASVQAGIWRAGGIPLHMPVMSLGEAQMRPSAMLYRNLAAMSIEEMLRANPLDGAVLLGGCDKTIPALLMAAASVDLPAILVPGGPMLSGHLRGHALGCGTDVWRLSEEVRANALPEEVLTESELAMVRSDGHCNTMGTASTMACLAEALGMTIPGTAGIPAPDSRLLQAAHDAGRLAVSLVAENVRPSALLTEHAFHNAIVTLSAIGGSTNGVLHLLAIAGRAGVPLTLDDFDRIGSDVPLLLDLQPAGRYLMDDLHRAGGLKAVLQEVQDLLDSRALTVGGGTLVSHLENAEIYDYEVIRRRTSPLMPAAGIAVLRGNLCPDGALIKPAAASESLLRHRGRAVVFNGIDDARHRIDDPALELDETSVLILRGCGPKGYPGMPEVGNLPLPAKLLASGVRDMVRISDARMSGTAYGTVVLHVSPEAAAGGMLARVRDGDPIVLDVAARKLEIDLPAADLERRNPEDLPSYASPGRGWERLYVNHVLQADRGADLDFLVGRTGDGVPRESH